MTTRARAFYLLKKSDKSDFIRLFKSDFIRLFKIRSTALLLMHLGLHWWKTHKKYWGVNEIETYKYIGTLFFRYSFVGFCFWCSVNEGETVRSVKINPCYIDLGALTIFTTIIRLRVKRMPLHRKFVSWFVIFILLALYLARGSMVYIKGKFSIETHWDSDHW